MSRSKWTKENVIRKLKDLHRAGEELSYTRLARTEQSLVSAAAYHFGTYPKAVEKAGIDYSLVTRRPRWTRQRIIAQIKEGKRKGEDLHWGAVTKRRDELGKAAFASLQKRLFGSWDRALHAAGLDADEVSRYRRWDPNSIVYELRSRHKDGDALNSGAVQKTDPGLHAAAVRHFGTYDKALAKAKLNVAAIRQRRRWTHEMVVRELRAFQRRHRTLADGLLRKMSPALYGAALRLFKHMKLAREAAGGGGRSSR